MNKLIAEAKRIMTDSPDPYHDHDHVARVSAYTHDFSTHLGITDHRRTALALAGWWHDAGRTITRNPSMLWMPFFDDIISSIMLWRTMRRFHASNIITKLAARIIICKSLGTGAVLTRLLMAKKDRILVDILKDADALDVLNQQRMVKLLPLVASSRLYHFGYKTVIRWFVTSEQLYMNTDPARAEAEEMLRMFLTWIQETTIFMWHVDQFGEDWVENMLAKAEVMLRRITTTNATTVVVISV